LHPAYFWESIKRLDEALRGERGGRIGYDGRRLEQEDDKQYRIMGTAKARDKSKRGTKSADRNEAKDQLCNWVSKFSFAGA